MNNLTEVDDKQRDLMVLDHNLKGFNGNFINEELYRQGQKSWAMQWEKRLCRAWEVLQVGNFALRRHDSRLTLLRGRHQWRSWVSSSNPLLYVWRGWNQTECRWNQKTIAGEPLHGWSGHFKKFMAQLRLSLIGSMEEDIILRSQLSFESAFIIWTYF